MMQKKCGKVVLGTHSCIIDHVWSRSHMYQSHSFCLVNVHSFSQWYTMDCPLWKFLKSFSDIWDFIENERWMYYIYFYTYLSSFLSFLYLYVCLSRKGFIRLDITFLNGLLNIWKLIWFIINVLAFETKICDN